MNADIFLLQNFDHNNKLDIRKHINTKIHYLHYHDCVEMTILPYGTGIHFINGKEYPIQSPHFAIFGENDYHSLYGLSEKNCIYTLMIHPTLVSKTKLEMLNNDINAKLCNLDKDHSLHVLHLFDIIKDSKNSYPDQFYKNIIDCLFTIFYDAFKNTSIKQNIENTMSLPRVLSYINTNFKDDLSLQHLARQFGYSISNLSEQFHKNTGLSFVEYINNIRINYAKRLLKDSNYSISYICYESGFHSMASFSRNFKNILGITPSQFRKNLLT